MSGQPGQRWAKTRQKDAYEPSLGDPAKGAKVPRCCECGMPDRPGVPLLPGFWRYAARQGIDYTLCEECYLARVPNQKGEPITLEDVA